MSGCAATNKAARELSIDLSAKVIRPLPMVRKAVPAIRVLTTCCLEILIDLPLSKMIENMIMEAMKNLIPAARKGGNSNTKILTKR